MFIIYAPTLMEYNLADNKCPSKVGCTTGMTR